MIGPVARAMRTLGWALALALAKQAVSHANEFCTNLEMN